MRRRNVAYALLLVLAALVAAGTAYLLATSGPHEGPSQAGFVRDDAVRPARAVDAHADLPARQKSDRGVGRPPDGVPSGSRYGE